MTTDVLPPPTTTSRVIMLTFGQMNHGGPYWCYVAVKPSRYDEFRQKMASMTYNMQQFDSEGYGEIVVSGEGIRPPSAISKQVAALYNIPLTVLFNNEPINDNIHLKNNEA